MQRKSTDPLDAVWFSTIKEKVLVIVLLVSNRYFDQPSIIGGRAFSLLTILGLDA